jgi:hypothetical protein
MIASKSKALRIDVVRFCWLACIGTQLLGGCDEKHQVSSKTKETVTQNACATAAFTEYVKESGALADREGKALSTLQPTVTFVIERRRLEENFCLQFASCLVSNPATQTQLVEYSLDFESCLRDETQQQYEDESDDQDQTAD